MTRLKIISLRNFKVDWQNRTKRSQKSQFEKITVNLIWKKVDDAWKDNQM